MKKWILVILALALLLCACGTESEKPPATTQATHFLGTSAYEPRDMVGTWIMTGEGMDVETDPVSEGRGTLVIAGSTAMDMTATYTDIEVPEDSFSDKSLLVWAGALYPDCSNSAWAADVDYVGVDDTTFVLTLLDNGTLIMQVTFQLDGAPVVSYRTFIRAE